MDLIINIVIPMNSFLALFEHFSQIYFSNGFIIKEVRISRKIQLF